MIGKCDPPQKKTTTAFPLPTLGDCLTITTWWTSLINISQNGNLPQIGVNIKNIWNHHLDHFPLLAILRGRCMFVGVRFSISGRPITNQGQANQQKHNSASRFGRKSFHTFFVAQCSCCTFELPRRLLHSVFSLGGFPPSQFNSDPRGLLHFWEGIPVNLNIIPQKTGSGPHPRYKAKKTPQQWIHLLQALDTTPTQRKKTSRRFPTSPKSTEQFFTSFFATKNCSSLKKDAGASLQTKNSQSESWVITTDHPSFFYTKLFLGGSFPLAPAHNHSSCLLDACQLLNSPSVGGNEYIAMNGYVIYNPYKLPLFMGLWTFWTPKKSWKFPSDYFPFQEKGWNVSR